MGLELILYKSVVLVSYRRPTSYHRHYSIEGIDLDVLCEVLLQKFSESLPHNLLLRGDITIDQVVLWEFVREHNT